MAICGVVVTVDSRERGLRSLRRIPGLVVAQDTAHGERRIPCVLEVRGEEAYARRWQQIAAAPGIARLELAFVDFDDGRPARRADDA